MTYQEEYAGYVELLETALKIFLPMDIVEPLCSAMQYSVLNGGKRLRGVLCLAAANLLGGSIDEAVPFGCAIEMIHAYSLIHDDLPCMDDDDTRRGKPSNHRVFGEAMALLAGDGLLSRAFEVMLESPTKDRDKVAAMKAVAKGAGVYGMVAGQCLDISASTILDPEMLAKIHEGKTGAMIKASLLTGALLNRPLKEESEAVAVYGEQIGLAFQIVDDILDVTGDVEKLGKRTSKDSQMGKLTYPALYGVEKSRELARECTRVATDAIAVFGPRAAFLTNLATTFLKRDH